MVQVDKVQMIHHRLDCGLVAAALLCEASKGLAREIVPQNHAVYFHKLGPEDCCVRGRKPEVADASDPPCGRDPSPLIPVSEFWNKLIPVWLSHGSQLCVS